MRSLHQAWEANDLYGFALAGAVALAAWAALALARYVLARVVASLARRTGSLLGESVARAIRETRLWLLLPLAAQAGSLLLELPPRLERLMALAALAGLVLQSGLWTSRIIRDWIERRTARRPGAEGDAVTALALLGFAARMAVWAVVVLVLLDQLGFNITALVAGLGIGGVAIALAVQNILGDLFASLSIILDRPFVVGDFIVVDSLRGTVERVGVKTTRVRSLDGELLVFSNSDLLRSRIRNFKDLRERRVAFDIGVIYETPVEKVRAIPALLRAAVEAQPGTRFDRAHFRRYGDSALLYETVYYVLSADYNVCMDVQQAVNLAILDRFAAEGIGFAYPTRTLRFAPTDAPEPVADTARAAASK